jgi:hypothetical protein
MVRIQLLITLPPTPKFRNPKVLIPLDFEKTEVASRFIKLLEATVKDRAADEAAQRQQTAVGRNGLGDGGGGGAGGGDGGMVMREGDLDLPFELHMLEVSLGEVRSEYDSVVRPQRLTGLRFAGLPLPPTTKKPQTKPPGLPPHGQPGRGARGPGAPGAGRADAQRRHGQPREGARGVLRALCGSVLPCASSRQPGWWSPLHYLYNCTCFVIARSASTGQEDQDPAPAVRGQGGRAEGGAGEIHGWVDGWGRGAAVGGSGCVGG